MNYPLNLSKKELELSAVRSTTSLVSGEETNSLLPGFIYVPPCPPELAKATLRPPVAR